jgi:hypothetical protein
MVTEEYAAARDAVTEARLGQLGFSDVGNICLLALRSVHPFIEFVESDQQWHRLCFLKWRLRHENWTADKATDCSAAMSHRRTGSAPGATT